MVIGSGAREGVVSASFFFNTHATPPLSHKKNAYDATSLEAVSLIELFYDDNGESDLTEYK